VSQQNVEIVRRGIEAFNAGDMASRREHLDPDVVMRMAEGFPESGPFVGREAVMRWIMDAREPFDDFILEPTSDIIDVGDRVVVRLRSHATGRGPDVRFEFSEVSTFWDGRIVYIQFFWDHHEAVKAVGLEE
jgi:ketosteroid isomerase-like protein